MLSHPLLAQSLPVVAVKAAPTADATGFDRLIQSEKTNSTPVDLTELSTPPESEAEPAAEENALSTGDALDEALDGVTHDPAADVEPELAQSDRAVSDLTAQPTPAPHLSDGEAVAAEVSEQTIDPAPANAKDRTVAPNLATPPETRETLATEPDAIGETVNFSDSAEPAADAPLKGQTGAVLQDDLAANTDSPAPQIAPVSATPEPTKNTEVLLEEPAGKTTQDVAPTQVTLAQITQPETPNAEATKTTDQPSFQSMVVEASAEPATVETGTDGVKSPALPTEIIGKPDAETPNNIAFAPPQNRAEPLRTASADIAPRQDASPAAAPVTAGSATAGIVEVNLQATPATDMPRSFTGMLQKPATEVQANAPSASPKTAEVQPLADTPASAPVQQIRPTLTPIPAPAEAQQPPAPQPSKSPIVRQVMDQLVQYPTENGMATIRLKPHGMGVIEITVERTKEGSLTVDMRVQNPLVLEAMRNERAAISHLFQPTANSAGGTLSMDLFQSGTGRNGQDQQGQAAKDTPSGTAQNTSEDTQDTPVMAQNQQTRASGVLNILT
nr:hypothetical protein [Amylibacter sp.]